MPLIILWKARRDFGEVLVKHVTINRGTEKTAHKCSVQLMRQPLLPNIHSCFSYCNSSLRRLLRLAHEFAWRLSEHFRTRILWRLHLQFHHFSKGEIPRIKPGSARLLSYCYTTSIGWRSQGLHAHIHSLTPTTHRNPAPCAPCLLFIPTIQALSRNQKP